MKLHHDGTHHKLITFAANFAHASHPVWLGGQIPRMQSQPMPNAVRQVLDNLTVQLIVPSRYIQQQYIQRRRVVPAQRRVQQVVLTAIGIQLSALPPPFLWFAA